MVGIPCNGIWWRLYSPAHAKLHKTVQGVTGFGGKGGGARGVEGSRVVEVVGLLECYRC